MQSMLYPDRRPTLSGKFLVGESSNNNLSVYLSIYLSIWKSDLFQHTKQIEKIQTQKDEKTKTLEKCLDFGMRKLGNIKMMKGKTRRHTEARAQPGQNSLHDRYINMSDLKRKIN